MAAAASLPPCACPWLSSCAGLPQPPCADQTSNTWFLVTYPTGAGATVYQLDGNTLAVVKKWTPATLSLFDLQFSPAQGAMFGIAVSGTYGRILSQFTLSPSSSDITARSLFTLPNMWYVWLPAVPCDLASACSPALRPRKRKAGPIARVPIELSLYAPPTPLLTHNRWQVRECQLL
jgi:hypothetical protein